MSRPSRASRLRKNAGTLSFRGAGSAREPGIHEHGPEKSVVWPVFMGSGPGPDGPSRNDTRVFQHPARDGLAGDRVSLFAALLLPRRHPHPNPPPSRGRAVEAVVTATERQDTTRPD